MGEGKAEAVLQRKEGRREGSVLPALCSLRPAVLNEVNAMQSWVIKAIDRVGCGCSYILEVVTFCPITKGFLPGGWQAVVEKRQAPSPVRRATANLNTAQNVLPSDSLLLYLQFSETTAEFQIMKKELEELKSVNRRRK